MMKLNYEEFKNKFEMSIELHAARHSNEVFDKTIFNDNEWCEICRSVSKEMYDAYLYDLLRINF